MGRGRCIGWWVGCGLALLAGLSYAERLSFDDVSRGLGNYSVLSLLEDHQGFLWAATENGLHRFDGARWALFGEGAGVRGRVAAALHEDARGRLWVGTESGLFVLEDRLHAQEVLLEGEPIRMWGASSLTSDAEGHVWAVGQPGLLEVSFDASGWRARRAASTGEGERASGVFQVGQALYLGCGMAL
jgi:ligand-binding sensor domain-containing protein